MLFRSKAKWGPVLAYPHSYGGFESFDPQNPDPSKAAVFAGADRAADERKIRATNQHYALGIHRMSSAPVATSPLPRLGQAVSDAASKVFANTDALGKSHKRVAQYFYKQGK